MTTTQILLLTAIVGEVGFIAGFVVGTRRMVRRFRELSKRRHRRRVVHVGRSARSADVQQPVAVSDERRAGVRVPARVYALPVRHEAQRSIAE